MRVAGKDVHFTLDFQQAEVHEADRKDGSREDGWKFRHVRSGHRGRICSACSAFEVYDKFPNILLSTVEYKNTGSERSRHRKKRESEAPLECSTRGREGASMGNVVVSWRQLRLGER